MDDLTPAEAAIFATYGQFDLERTRRIVAAVRPAIEAELREQIAAEILAHEYMVPLGFMKPSSAEQVVQLVRQVQAGDAFIARGGASDGQ